MAIANQGPLCAVPVNASVPNHHINHIHNVGELPMVPHQFHKKTLHLEFIQLRLKMSSEDKITLTILYFQMG